MFVGAINATVRQFLGNTARVFDGATVVVGCSSNFTSEAVIAQYARPAAIHSNDVSFYSCLAGGWLTGQPLDFEVVDPDYQWLGEHMTTETRKLAAVMVLLDMLEFDKRNNKHRVRMWSLFYEHFGGLVDETVANLEQVTMRPASYFAGDVFDHFSRFADDPSAIFCCYAPTYAGGYERLYKRLGQIVRWEEPSYSLLDDKRRGELLGWMAARRYVWYDDRVLAGYTPVMKQRHGRARTVYLYSNVMDRPAVFDDRQPGELPALPLAGAAFEVRADSRVWLQRIKTTDLARFKEAFLGKNIEAAEGMWAYAVMVDGRAVGFLEYTREEYGEGRGGVYLMADFAVPGTRYARLSKLVVMLARAGETRRVLERAREYRTVYLRTTAFTDRPVSMKYRGVFDLEKRGETKDGQKFLNYRAEFDGKSWQEVLAGWLTRHGSAH